MKHIEEAFYLVQEAAEKLSVDSDGSNEEVSLRQEAFRLMDALGTYGAQGKDGFNSFVNGINSRGETPFIIEKTKND